MEKKIISLDELAAYDLNIKGYITGQKTKPNGIASLDVEGKVPVEQLPDSFEDGKSAYQIAVDNGFTGSEQEWLESLIGAQGPQGEAGADGQSITSIVLKGEFDYSPGNANQYDVYAGDTKVGTFDVVNGQIGPQGQHGQSITGVQLQGTYDSSSGATNTYDVLGEDEVFGSFQVTNGGSGITTVAPNTDEQQYVTPSNGKLELMGQNYIQIEGEPQGNIVIIKTTIQESQLLTSEQATKLNTIQEVPKGLISMWSGNQDNIPEGWVICDGRGLSNDTLYYEVWVNTSIIPNKYWIGNKPIETGNWEARYVTYLDQSLLGAEQASNSGPFEFNDFENGGPVQISDFTYLTPNLIDKFILGSRNSGIITNAVKQTTATAYDTQYYTLVYIMKI